MKFWIVLLTSAILIQPLSQALIVVHYGLNKSYITEQFCVNKAKPEMKCEGKCHLNKSLKENDEDQRQVPKTLKTFSETVLYAYDYNFTYPLLPFVLYEFVAQTDGFTSVFTADLFRPPKV